MNKTTYFDPWHDRHEINMVPGVIGALIILNKNENH